MPVYDSTFILNPQLEEGGLDGRIKDAVDLINNHGGKVIKENRLGMRRMAYEIQKLTQGYYVSLVFDGTNETVMELERQFRLDEACLRFLTCHFQDFSRKKDRKEVTVKKVEATPIDENKPDAPKPETPKPEDLKPDAPKPEPPKPEPPKPEDLKPEAPASDVAAEPAVPEPDEPAEEL